MLTVFCSRTLWEQQKDFNEARDEGMAVASSVPNASHLHLA